ncbi:unnamed protein product [Rotaria magnacalcarata]|uniref:Uncharacterized protein n=1 Tax=Rotaria magnacalcarata TaxID=392030 RepID=A0A815ZJL9_9BILA|nr:unnamed protein product [Rotaria magnacalcarata]CAF4066595.1 unnamed protein product [Rotaria magnacalcarata]
MIIVRFAIRFEGQYDLVTEETDDGAAKFSVTGDWGDLPVSSFDTQSEVAIVNAMGKLRIKLNTTSQFTLGDNFYYDGVKAHLTNTMNWVLMNYCLVDAAHFLIDSSQEHAKHVPNNYLKFVWAGAPVYGGFPLMEHNYTHLRLPFIDHSEQTLYHTTMTTRS